MFYSLTGKIVYKNLYGAAIECSGVAFFFQASEITMQSLELSKTATVFTHLNVREDALDLFGFSTEEERDWFRLFTSVSGVGPKAAIAILSLAPTSKLAMYISSGDYKAITKANGIGPKIAQRVVNELRDKVAGFASETEEVAAVASVSGNSNKSEAVSALTMLGYTQTDASAVVAKLDPNLSVEELIRQALKKLSSFKF